MSRSPAMGGARWTDTDDEILLDGKNGGKSHRQIGRSLQRTERACRLRLHNLTGGALKRKLRQQGASTHAGRDPSPQQRLPPLRDLEIYRRLPSQAREARPTLPAPEQEMGVQMTSVQMTDAPAPDATGPYAFLNYGLLSAAANPQFGPVASTPTLTEEQERNDAARALAALSTGSSTPISNLGRGQSRYDSVVSPAVQDEKATSESTPASTNAAINNLLNRDTQ